MSQAPGERLDVLRLVLLGVEHDQAVVEQRDRRVGVGRRPRRRTCRRCRAGPGAARRCRRTSVPSSATVTWRFSSSTDPTNASSSTSRSPSSVGSESSVPSSVSPSSAYGPSSSAGSKSRYCSPTAERLWTYIGESSGSSVPSSSARSRVTPVAGRVHRRDLADLDAAVGHLAALEQPAGRRQGRVHGDAAAEDPVDEAEVGRGDVDDADRAEHHEGDQPELGPARHARTPVEGSWCRATRTVRRWRARTRSDRRGRRRGSAGRGRRAAPASPGCRAAG